MTSPLRKTSFEHIELDENGVPHIAGANMKVVELVLNKLAYGWSPEELHFQHPHLSLGQIYSALAFYYDHKDMMDRDIQRREERIERIKRELPLAPLVLRLKSKRGA